MTDNSDKKVMLEKIPCIYYLICFQEDQEQIKALLNSGNKVNVISLVYIKKLGLKIWKTNVGVQKINGSIFKTFKIVIANIQIKDKVGRSRFF